MDEQRLRAMKTYMIFRKSAGSCMMWAAGVILVGALLLGVNAYTDYFVRGNKSMLLPALGLTFLVVVFGAASFMSLVWPPVSMALKVRKWARAGKLDAVLSDFEQARQMAGGDSVRLGDTWIFGRACGGPVKYDNIASMKVVTLGSRAAAKETALYAVLRNGRTVRVCRELHTGQASQAMRNVISTVKLRNPGVTLE